MFKDSFPENHFYSYIRMLCEQTQIIDSFDVFVEIFNSPLKLSKCVKKKDCLWKSSMACTMGPSRLLRRVFFDPLLSAISDSSMVRTMYSCRGGGKITLITHVRRGRMLTTLCHLKPMQALLDTCHPRF